MGTCIKMKLNSAVAFEDPIDYLDTTCVRITPVFAKEENPRKYSNVYNRSNQQNFYIMGDACTLTIVGDAEFYDSTNEVKLGKTKTVTGTPNNSNSFAIFFNTESPIYLYATNRYKSCVNVTNHPTLKSAEGIDVYCDWVTYKDVKDFQYYLDINKMPCVSRPTTGNIKDFADYQSLNGRTSGSVTFSCNGIITIVEDGTVPEPTQRVYVHYNANGYKITDSSDPSTETTVYYDGGY